VRQPRLIRLITAISISRGVKMALLGNYSVLCKNPIRYFGGSTTSVEVQVRSNFGRSGDRRNWEYRDGATGAGAALDQASLPPGCYQPYAYMLPQTAGQISSRGGMVGSGSVVSSMLASNGAMVATLRGSGTIVAYPSAGGVDRLKEIWQIHGLDAANPLTVSSSDRAAGTIDQTISGTTTVTVQRN
jgi:hypothetical protein